MALEIITVGGVDILAQMFNAIAVITSNTSFFHLMGAAEILGVAACVLRYVQRHDLKDLGKWLIFFVFINGILLTPKVDLVFTDKIYTTKVKKVDNVPVGVATPFYMFSLGGNALAEMYDTFLSQPNDVRYTRTGMLFGQRLLDSSFNMIPKDARFQANLANFVESCIIPDIEINHKYSYKDVFDSKNLNEFFFNSPKFTPSQARTMFYTSENNSREYITCNVATARLKVDMDKMIAKALQDRKNSTASVVRQKKGETESYKVLGYSPNMYDIPQDMVQQVHTYLMGASQSANDIYKQNMLVNKLRRDFQQVPAAFDGTSDMIGNASEQALMKWRLANLASSDVASRTLPALYTVFSALLVGIFPIIILAMFVTELTGTIIKSYMGFLFSLMLYPVLFAIFNSIVNILTYQTLNGESFTISNADTIRANLSDVAATSGYLMMSIPFISFGLIKGLGQAISSAGSYLGNALSSATSAEASQVSTGNYNWGNMQMENVNGFKTDLNHVFKHGQSTYQNGDGLLVTQHANGRYSVDATQATSKLSTNINWSKAFSSTYQQSASAEQRKSEEAQRGYRNSMTEATNIANGFNHSRGKTVSDGDSDTYGTGTNNNNSLRSSTGVHNADGSKVSHDSSSKQNDSEQLSATYSAGASASAGFEVLGSGIKGDLSARGAYNSVSSEDNSTGRSRIGDTLLNTLRNYDKTHDITKVNNDMHQLLHSEMDVDTRNKVENFLHSVNQAHDSFNQATESNSKAKTYSELASKSESITQSVSEDLNSQFVDDLYQSGKYTHEQIEKMLSPVPSSEMRAMRDNAISEFLQSKSDMVEQVFNNNRERVDDFYNQAQVDKYGQNVAPQNNVAIPSNLMDGNNQEQGTPSKSKEAIEQARLKNQSQYVVQDAAFEIQRINAEKKIAQDKQEVLSEGHKQKVKNYHITKDAEALKDVAPKTPRMKKK